MKIYASIFAATVAIGICGYLFIFSDNNKQNDPLVSKEVALLERFNEGPPCKKILKLNKPIYSELKNNAVIIWKYNKDSHNIEKIVVDHELTLARDQIQNTCRR